MKSAENRKIIAALLSRLIDGYAPQKIWLYGSHADGIPGPDSDIDLLIIKETSDRMLDRWKKVQSIIAGTHQGVPVETLVLTHAEFERQLNMGDQFIQNILARGEELYAA